MEEDQLTRDERIKAHVQAMIEMAEEELAEDEEWGECFWRSFFERYLSLSILHVTSFRHA